MNIFLLDDNKREESPTENGMYITIRYNTSLKLDSADNRLFITLEELRSWVLKGSIIKHLFRYQEAQLFTYNLDVVPKPFFVALLLRFLSRRSCSFRDEKGRVFPITVRLLATLFWRFLVDSWEKSSLLKKTGSEVRTLSLGTRSQKTSEPLDLFSSPVYLRTDLWFGVPSGGSVGHIAGVLNNLDNFAGKPVFLTTDVIPTVRMDIEVHYIEPEQRFWDFNELPGFFFNKTFEDRATPILSGRQPAFIYQRYSLSNYSGVKLARSFGVPFVLEYNGSEIWINRHWGKPLKYEALSERIEMLNLKAADLIVVVSRPMRDELTGRGIDAGKILVNPNGVDRGCYSPEVDGSEIRQKYGLDGATVIGFIGTFGRWHGAEVLAEAFGRLLSEHPAYRASVRLLMIGDGVTMPLAKEALAKYAVGDACILTGRIPQEDGPEYLAACDILSSPHVPNPDGTPFFGSPTKLFEYMAMGKGIVASELDQIGEILEHDKTAWMVEPGDAESLMFGLRHLIDERQLRERLGKAARSEVAKYTWKEHTRKIVDKLREVVQIK